MADCVQLNSKFQFLKLWKLFINVYTVYTFKIVETAIKRVILVTKQLPFVISHYFS